MVSKSAALRNRQRAIYNDFERAHLAVLNALLDKQSEDSLSAQISAGKIDPEQFQRDAKQFLFRILFCLTAHSRNVLFPSPLNKEDQKLKDEFQLQIGQLQSEHNPLSSNFWKLLQRLGQSRFQLGRVLNSDPSSQRFLAQSISNQSLSSILNALPYPSGQNPWTDPDLNILSALYEQSLKSRPQFDPDKKRFQPSHDSLSRRKAGSFYTPEKLVQFILDRNLQSLIDSSPDSLRLRITDPSCGCGRFLIPAAKMLAAALCEKEHSSSIPCTSCKTTIVENCIHGVDLDPSALELCRFHFLIWTESPTLTLQKLEAIIEYGDALAPPLEQNLKTETPPQRFCWRSSQARRWNEQGFDLVVGNPPYVSYYSKHSKASDNQPDNESYTWLLNIKGERALPGRINLFLYFISLATQLTRDQGRFVFVLPDTILTNEQYTDTRKALLKHGTLEEAWLFRHSVFSDASVGTTVLSWSNQDSKDKVVRIFEVDEMEDDPKKRRQEFPIPPSALLKRPKAHFYPGPETPQLPDSIPLGDKAHVKDGMNPGPREVRTRLIRSSKENDHCHPLIEGNNIHPLSIHWGGRWIDCSPTLLSREDKRRGASLRQEWIFQSDKIVYRQTASKPIAALDFQSYRCLNSVHNIVLKEESRSALIALCCYLNSSLCSQIYRAFSGESRKLFPQVHVSLMKTLPVPHFLFQENSEWTQKLIQIWKRSFENESNTKGHENGLQQIDQVMQNYLNCHGFD
ncbi:MAG: N-6 DNA methylase [Planctomycetota bacterium]|nr:N-6 DNA methylase [Planctomycetota bacterium]